MGRPRKDYGSDEARKEALRKMNLERVHRHRKAKRGAKAKEVFQHGPTT